MKLTGMIRRNKLLAFVIGTYAFLFMAMPDKASSSVRNSMYYIIEMIEIMPVIFVLTAIIETWVPKEVIMKGFGEKAGVKGVFFSFLLGSFSAGPIYAAFPISKMLLKKGASISNVVIILSAWAVIKVPMLANESKFLGIEFMGTRWVLTVISIIAMSMVVAMIVKKKDIPFDEVLKAEKIAGVEVNQEYCIGCGFCASLMPDEFEMDGGKAHWVESSLDTGKLVEYEPVMEKCPAQAIKFV